jgi:hypothetical protein
MLFFKTVDGTIKGKVVLVSEDTALEGTVSRWDFKTYADAEAIAKSANEMAGGTDTYIATDAGEYTSPRYDVQRVPKVGELVSKGFNGDYYPCGKIVSVGTGAKMVVKTDTGAVFYRRKLTGSWVKEGGTWYLVAGHKSDKNPHF